MMDNGQTTTDLEPLLLHMSATNSARTKILQYDFSWFTLYVTCIERNDCRSHTLSKAFRVISITRGIVQ